MASEYDVEAEARAFLASASHTPRVPGRAHSDLEHVLRRAYAAGRDSGIEEAARACDRLVRENRVLGASMHASSAEECAEAVRALKGGDRG